MNETNYMQSLSVNNRLQEEQRRENCAQQARSRDSSIASGAGAMAAHQAGVVHNDPKKPSTAQIVAQNYQNYVNERRSATAEHEAYPLKRLAADAEH